ncbi:proline-rich protein HaeIII subfamily 1-like [Heterocephalus glaber]|uniref:Proline-rich protein HaeIII subfamily 1-like n=1 Tax=Heterocephalus glaber TaxID=10181 RepID=A0AAX6S5Q1_HETGA|nr:proline-rich protein HaeIII subfamily 1-like [Heterocephalus glaber]
MPTSPPRDPDPIPPRLLPLESPPLAAQAQPSRRRGRGCERAGGRTRPRSSQRRRGAQAGAHPRLGEWAETRPRFPGPPLRVSAHARSRRPDPAGSPLRGPVGWRPGRARTPAGHARPPRWQGPGPSCQPPSPPPFPAASGPEPAREDEPPASPAAQPDAESPRPGPAPPLAPAPAPRARPAATMSLVPSPSIAPQERAQPPEAALGGLSRAGEPGAPGLESGAGRRSPGARALSLRPFLLSRADCAPPFLQ